MKNNAMKTITITDQALLDLFYARGAPFNTAPCEIEIDQDVYGRIEAARMPGDSDERALKRVLSNPGAVMPI